MEGRPRGHRTPEPDALTVSGGGLGQLVGEASRRRGPCQRPSGLPPPPTPVEGHAGHWRLFSASCSLSVLGAAKPLPGPLRRRPGLAHVVCLGAGHRPSNRFLKNTSSFLIFFNIETKYSFLHLCQISGNHLQKNERNFTVSGGNWNELEI